MLSGSLIGHGTADQRHVIGLCAAGCKKDLLFIYLQRSGNDLPCIFYIAFRIHALHMEG